MYFKGVNTLFDFDFLKNRACPQLIRASPLLCHAVIHKFHYCSYIVGKYGWYNLNRMEELLKMLNSWFPMSPELQVTLLQRVYKEVHRKNKLILKAGEICDWVGFVEKGLCKTTYEPEKGIERVMGFFREGNMIGSMKSFYYFLPSKLSIRAIEETHLRKIRKVELESIYEKYTEFNINGRKITEQYFSSYEDHLVLMAMPAKERFNLLIHQSPSLLNDSRIKDYMLAAFLGIDKATMSRFRNANKKVDPNQQLSFFD